MTLNQQRRALADQLHRIDWDGDTLGWLQCPAQHLHTGLNARRDCRLTLNDDRPPTIYCVHNSCRDALAIANQALRSAIGKIERAHERGEVATPAGGRRYEIRPTLRAPEPVPTRPRKPVQPVELPAPLSDGTRRHLAATFEPEDMVSIVRANGRGEVASGGALQLATDDVDEWPHGTFVRVNPMTGAGRSDADVVRFRHVLLEGDKSDKRTQYAAIVASGLPVSVVVDSGGKSIHAWVRVDAANAEEYRDRGARAAAALEEYEGVDVDRACLNASRLARLAGCARGEARQELLAVNLGATSWAAWEAAQREVVAIVTTATRATETAAGERTVERVEVREEFAPATARDALCDQFGFHRGRSGYQPSTGAMGRVFEGFEGFQGRIWWDDFHGKAMTTLNANHAMWASPSTPHAVTDAHIEEMTAWAQDIFGMPGLASAMVHEGLRVAARRTRKHCLREWLTGLKWDGISRLEDVLPKGFGTPNDQYHCRVSASWLLSLVARAMRPGCKVDTMPVFEGKQGAGKSTALAILGGEYHGEVHEDFGSQNFCLSLHGKWLLEVAEMHAFGRQDVDRLKGILSTQTDRFRAPYGRVIEDHPRQSVFAGTTNRDDWAQDDTGARRFWPVRCATIALPWLEVNRDAIFAEAVARFNANESWWQLPIELCEQHQQDRMPEDPWAVEIAKLGEDRTWSISEILESILKLEANGQHSGHVRRVAALLRNAGWECYKEGKDKLRRWKRK